MHQYIKQIDELVIPHEKPALFLSGGVDSTVVLHHLSQKCDDLHTYTVKYGFSNDESDHAAEVAAHYGTTHHTVEIDDLFEPMVEVLKHFDRPRFNIWPYFMFKAAEKDGRKSIYLGEGGDEHFGGYKMVASPLKNHEAKPYIQWWMCLLTWILPMYQGLADQFNMNIYSPLFDLNWKETIHDHCPPNKLYLRHMYRDILPKSVIDKPKQAPANTSYRELWDKMLSKHFDNSSYVSDADVIFKMQILASRKWLEAHGAINE